MTGIETTGKGKRWPSERKTSVDRLTGLEVTQLTDYKAHSHHLYFTENGWYDRERRLLFVSDRGNSTNLYSMDLESGEITQLTDYEKNNALDACLLPDGSRCSFHSQKVHAYPRFDERGKRLLFTSDKNGYANLYLIDIPERFEELPIFRP